jgi:hypothetical protein
VAFAQLYLYLVVEELLGVLCEQHEEPGLGQLGSARPKGQGDAVRRWLVVDAVAEQRRERARLFDVVGCGVAGNQEGQAGAVLDKGEVLDEGQVWLGDDRVAGGRCSKINRFREPVNLQQQTASRPSLGVQAQGREQF